MTLQELIAKQNVVLKNNHSKNPVVILSFDDDLQVVELKGVAISTEIAPILPSNVILFPKKS